MKTMPSLFDNTAHDTLHYVRAKNKKLKVLPPMRCDAGCGKCCGVVPCTTTELGRIRMFVSKHGIIPRDQEHTCPFYQEGTCAIYPVRPLICKAFGHVPQMPCAKGYNVNVAERELTRMLRANGKPRHMLHELLEGSTFLKNVAEFNTTKLITETGT